MKPSRALFATILSIIAAGARAEQLPLAEPMELPGVSYDASIPRPEQVTGHVIGRRHTRPDQIVSYFEAVAAASPRVKVSRHGETYEGRPLVHAVVTSPENHARLEAIRVANLRLSRGDGQVSDRELDSWPVVVWLGYSVHGNEAAPAEAALLLLYHLAAGSGGGVEQILQNTVILLLPMLNPDGRSRFVEWVNSSRSRVAVSDPQHREHNEPWPGGRGNHYWFDLNRDWLPARLRETQARLDLYHRWRPQLVTDHHEMGSESTFFFQPGVPTRNNPNTPAETLRLTAEIARYHARRLDALGSLYYSEESFDDFFYGKGSTYPDIHGAVGILFEQASSRALARETGGGILTYAATIRNHVAASLSTLDAAVDLRPRLLRNQQTFYREALEEAGRADLQGWLIPVAGNAGRGADFLEALLRHQVEVRELSRPFRHGDRHFEPGTACFVPARQPQWRLLRTMLERVTDFGDQVFYDISTWSLPPAFAVEPVPVPRGTPDLSGPPVDSIPVPRGGVVGAEPAYAYLLDWRQAKAPDALYALQSAGLRARVLTRPIEIDGGGREVRLPRGTIAIPSGPEVRPRLEEAARRLGVEFRAISSGLTPEGPDLGSPSAPWLERPRPAIIAGEGVRSTQAGEAWFELAEVRGMKVSLIQPERLDSLDLSRYNVLILPGGNHQRILEAGVTALKNWIRAGGRLIVLTEGVRWAIEKGIVEERLRERARTKIEVPFEEVSRARQAATIPGSIFGIRLDATHPLAYGLPEELAVFRDHDLLVEPSETPGSTVARYLSSPLVSGYAPQDFLPQLAGSAALIARRQGRGAVILFADNPNFRAFWPATARIFLNAVFFGVWSRE